MALRLLPYKQYSDKNVINLFALSTTSAGLDDPNTNGDNDNGVFVKVSAGDLDSDPIEYINNSLVGYQHASPVGRNYLPTVPLKVAAATTGSPCIGITLNQTLNRDENGEKLLYNPTKKAEMQAVGSGEAVPIATKGVFTITADAVDGSLSIGDQFKISKSDVGKIGPVASGASSDPALGVVLGTGSRKAGDGYAGNYYMIKLDA